MSGGTAQDPGVAARGVVALLALGLVTAAPEELAEVSYEKLKVRLRDGLRRDSMNSLAALALGGSYLFYLAERDVNPKCQTFMDALVFITTCFSVGYDDVFARSDAGKAIASYVMTVGPSLTATALDPPAHAPDDALAVNRAILGRLDEILEALRRRDPR